MTGDKTNLAHGSFLPRFLARRLGECCVQNKPHTTNSLGWKGVLRCVRVEHFPIGLSVILQTSKVYVRIYHKCLPPTVWNRRLRRHTTFYLTINTKVKVAPCSLW